MPVRPAKKVRLYGVKSKPVVPGYNRVRSADEYHSYRWTRESKLFRAEHPLCAICEKKGIIKAAEVVDHIVPFPVCKDFFDSKNWQSLCSKCNAEKGNRDKVIIQKFKENESKNANIKG